MPPSPLPPPPSPPPLPPPPSPPPPGAPPECLASDGLYIDLFGAEQIANNLGGKGPGTEGCDCLRYQRAGTYQGKSIDLVIVNGGAQPGKWEQYEPSDRATDPTYAAFNGLEYGMVMIDIKNKDHPADIEIYFQCASPY